jgi:hypothetical protein
MDRNDLNVTSRLTNFKLRVANLSPSRQIAGDRRRARRVRMQEGSPAQFHSMDATLIDISSSGALVEHTEPVGLGAIYRLSFPAEGFQVQVLTRVIRAFIGHRAPTPVGTPQIVCRTGVEFVEIANGTAERLFAYIDRHLLRKATEGRPEGAVQELRCSMELRAGGTPRLTN